MYGASVPKNSPPRPSGVKLIDRPSGPADSHELVRRLLVVRREHNAEHGSDDVEFAIVEREYLGVGLHPFQLDTARAGLAASGLEVLRSEIRGDNVRARLGGAHRDVARPGSHVEHSLAGRDPSRLDEHRSQLPHGFSREPVVVATCPHRPRGGLQLSLILRHGVAFASGWPWRTG
jgi:hypothetical protein